MATKKSLKTEKKITTHVSEFKKKVVTDLVKHLKENNTILLTSIDGVSSSLFNQIKRKLKAEGVITKVVKKKLIDLALEKVKSEKQGIEELEKYIDQNFAILFANKDAFEIASFLEDNKQPAKAKFGQIAPMDLAVEAGPTDLPAGPAISELAKVRLKAGIEGGKISIKERAILVKTGEKISRDVCDVLSLLGVTPFTTGFNPIASYDSTTKKTLYGIKIDKKGTLESLKRNAVQALALAIHIAYPTKETIKRLLGKAKLQSEKLNSYQQNNQP